jgi:hypothetical protein
MVSLPAIRNGYFISAVTYYLWGDGMMGWRIMSSFKQMTNDKLLCKEKLQIISISVTFIYKIYSNQCNLVSNLGYRLRLSAPIYSFFLPTQQQINQPQAGFCL